MTDHVACIGPDTDRVVAEHMHDDVDHIFTLLTKGHDMITNIRNNNALGTNTLANTSTTNSDGRSINRVRSLATTQAPQDVMVRSRMATTSAEPAQSEAIDLRSTIAGIANILQSLIGAAGELYGAVTNGLKKLLDAGTGIFGLVGNLLSQVLTRFS